MYYIDNKLKQYNFPDIYGHDGRKHPSSNHILLNSYSQKYDNNIFQHLLIMAILAYANGTQAKIIRSKRSIPSFNIKKNAVYGHSVYINLKYGSDLKKLFPDRFRPYSDIPNLGLTTGNKGIDLNINLPVEWKKYIKEQYLYSYTTL